jgi:hypothetical protein
MIHKLLFALALLINTMKAADPTAGLIPPPGEKPLEVEAAFHLNEIIEIDDKAETFAACGILTLTWQDSRQAFDPLAEGVHEKIYQGSYQFDELSPSWFPQFILKNQSDSLETSAVVQRIQSNGRCTLVSAIRISARTDFSMRRYPFDAHSMEAVFSLPGFTTDEVVFRGGAMTFDPEVGISQWHFTGVRGEARAGGAPQFAVICGVRRDAFFAIRLVALPLFLIVILSWSVFWMEKSSVGDRLGLTFVGILTAVAYQIVIGDLLPNVSYVTLMHGFLNISFFVMCAAVVVNLRVAHFDKTGRAAHGDLLDKRCRIAFPSIYLGLTSLITVVALVWFE